MPSSPSESARVAGRPPYPDLPVEAEARSDTDSAWVSRQVQAMVLSWARGERVTAQQLLARLPGLDDEAAIRLIYEEVCLRRDAGQEIATTEVVSQFPRWKDELEVLLGCDRMLRPFSRAAALPEAGEDLGPFRLLKELGRGASGRTYLAGEPALADRLVVLKVISDDQEEHLSLARLQHTHIIPLFSEQTFPERRLRALCMPYLGGTSLARILEGVSAIPPPRRRGRDLLEVLDLVQINYPVPWNSDGPCRRYLEQASFVQAVCWIAACLADALQCAHAHGLIHLDVKPSNVLIAGDGLPMLLDFHLARRPIQAGELISDRLGGTPGWMAPEHRAAFEAVSLGNAVAEPVDPRTDLYALGLLLREALFGPAAAQDSADARAWRRRNPEVSVGLADVVQKCLAAKPCDRYGDAGAMADDLRRELNDLPLRGVPNRSLAESWRKWRRRRPAAFLRWAAWLTTAAAIVAVLVLVQALYRQRAHDIRGIETALADGEALRIDGRFNESAQTLGRGLERARSVPAVTQLTSALSEQFRLARRGQKAAALHDLAELVRFRYGIDLPAAVEAQALLRNVRTIWDGRDFLLSSQAGALDAKTERAIRADLLDLAILWAELRVQQAASADALLARRDAVTVLDLANAVCGPSTRLDRLRRAIAGTPAQSESAQAPDPITATAFDHYDVGRSYLRSGAFREAAQEFQRVVDERPQDFWPNFYQGLCAYRLEQFQEALSAFRTCTALAPSSSQCYFNRALAAEALGRFDLASRDYSHALELDPSLTSASLNRGILAYKNGRYNDAITDFRRSLGTAADSQTIGRIHFNLALAYAARGDGNAAMASALEAVAHGYDEARSLRDRLREQP
jgi:serine/threonine protein kinase/tetratricopeptide (TPR) repeat protein